MIFCRILAGCRTGTALSRTLLALALRQYSPEELVYNPITHQVDVFVNKDGDIQKCEPSAGLIRPQTCALEAEEYRQMLIRLQNLAPKKGLEGPNGLA